MTTDELWPGGPNFIRGGGFSLGTDAVLLSSFALASKAGHVCDLGCGAGVIALLLAWNNPRLIVDGIEIQETAAETARHNMRINMLSERVNIVTGDIRMHRRLFDAGSYDLVVSNPPYFPSGSGKTAETEDAATARAERSCTLSDVCEAAAYLTRWGGRFALVHRPERLAEIICIMSSRGLEPKRLRFVQYKAGSSPNLILIEGRRGGNPGLSVMSPLILANDDGTDTDEIRMIYHR